LSEGSAGATYRRGDVVLVPMDFTDRSGSKVRPAIVVSAEEYNRGPDVLIASVTSNRDALPHPGDHRIRGWKAARLLKPSLVQTKLATVEVPMIRRKLGELSAEDLTAFEVGLREALGL
jgi:mRNA interferase MazF